MIKANIWIRNNNKCKPDDGIHEIISVCKREEDSVAQYIRAQTGMTLIKVDFTGPRVDKGQVKALQYCAVLGSKTKQLDVWFSIYV